MSTIGLPHTLLLAAPAVAGWFTAALFVALALRHPWRLLAGPRSAYMLWLLPPVAVLASLAASVWPVTPLRWPALTHTVDVLVQAGSGAAAQVTRGLPVEIGTLLVGLWLLGTAIALFMLTGRYLALRLALRAWPGDTLARHGVEVAGAHLVVHRHPAGPALLWAPRPLLVLPPDFEQRYDATQRRQILHHELCHHAQGDAWWNLLAALLGALFWWHPFGPWARRAFALDQELACDARLLASRQRPALRSYAGTLLQAASTLPLLLGSGVSHPRQLKERIAMLAQPRRSVIRRVIAAVLVSALLAGTAFAASHAMSAGSDGHKTYVPEAPSQDLTYNNLHPPRYPIDAIQKHEQGTVYLLVLVGTDGRPQQIKVKFRQDRTPVTLPAPSLVSAALDAAAQWKFTPAMRSGKAVAAWIEVPITFKLGDDAVTPAQPKARS